MADHPDFEQLRAFISGRLVDPNRCTAIETHIETCASCCKSLEKIGADTFEELAFSSPTSTLAQFDSAPRRSIVLTPDFLSELERSSGYEILELVGIGSMGGVYKARHTATDRNFAIKIVDTQLLTNEVDKERYLQESCSPAKLTHPNIALPVHAERIGDKMVIVSEWITGETLSQVVDRRGTLEPEVACKYILQVAKGLKHAHLHSMLHGDIKPSKLILTPEGLIKILGFGVAQLGIELRRNRITDGRTKLVGPSNYMAPEQTDAPNTVDIRADLFSLGCTFHFLLVGKSPLSWNPWSVLGQTKGAGTGTDEDLFRKIPNYLSLILTCLLARSPEDRFSSPGDLVAVLEKIVATRFVRKPLAHPAEHSAASGIKSFFAAHRRLATCSLAGAVCVGLLIVVMFLIRN